MSGSIGVKAKRPMPIATASDSAPAAATASGDRPGVVVQVCHGCDDIRRRRARPRDAFRRDVVQAAGVPQRAFALEARRAIQRRLVGRVLLQPEHLRPVVQRRRVQRAGRAEHRHLRHAERGGHVHQPRVVADHGPAAGDQREGLQQRGLAGQVEALASPAAPAISSHRSASLAEPSSTAGRVERAGQLGEVNRGPALGRPVLGARREDVILARLRGRLRAGRPATCAGASCSRGRSCASPSFSPLSAE